MLFMIKRSIIKNVKILNFDNEKKNICSNHETKSKTKINLSQILF